ncbi:carbon-nitrogen hydrolase family protein [Azotosporobacter soli]|uniref:carbon-nitrogen hydrolase family protein n=1 Tax=Azotosporobacter soli TaxID=3055040 RepID=UPI0031FE88AA
MQIKAALCQMTVVADKEANLEKAAQLIRSAADAGCAIAVLPEMFNCPYDNRLFADYAETWPEGPSLKRLAALAKETKMLVVGGSVPERYRGSLYNTAFVFDAQGTLLTRHRKMHLFDIDIPGGTFFQESATLCAGREITVAQGSGIVFGLGICYDMRFPELARSMTLKGAQILIYPGAFGPETGPAHWELTLRARAVDNQVFTLGVSPAPTQGEGYQAYGNSLAVDPWGRVLAKANRAEALLVVELDLSLLDKVRQELPLLAHRRPLCY